MIGQLAGRNSLCGPVKSDPHHVEKISRDLSPTIVLDVHENKRVLNGSIVFLKL